MVAVVIKRDYWGCKTLRIWTPLSKVSPQMAVQKCYICPTTNKFRDFLPSSLGRWLLSKSGPRMLLKRETMMLLTSTSCCWLGQSSAHDVASSPRPTTYNEWPAAAAAAVSTEDHCDSTAFIAVFVLPVMSSHVITRAVEYEQNANLCRLQNNYIRQQQKTNVSFSDPVQLV